MKDSSRRPLLACAILLTCFSQAPAARAQDPIDWRAASTCVDKVCAVAGTVAVAEDDGAVIRLFFDAERRDVAVVLLRAWFTTWPHYAGQQIVATGYVQRFRERTEVVVRTPDAIAVRAPQPPASPTLVAVPTDPPPTVAPTPAEVERLRQRVRDLEQQLREQKR